VTGCRWEAERKEAYGENLCVRNRLQKTLKGGISMAEWVNSEVVRAGAADENSTIFIRLRPLGGEFSARWFVAATPVKREMLATALTAITTALRVNAHIEARAEYSTLHRLYVTRDIS
jgi:hypothetical protein